MRPAPLAVTLSASAPNFRGTSAPNFRGTSEGSQLDKTGILRLRCVTAHLRLGPRCRENDNGPFSTSCTFLAARVPDSPNLARQGAFANERLGPRWPRRCPCPAAIGRPRAGSQAGDRRPRPTYSGCPWQRSPRRLHPRVACGALCRRRLRQDRADRRRVSYSG